MNLNRGNYKKYMSNNPLVSMVISKFLNEIKTTLETLNVNNALDVGCGEGFVTQYLNLKNSTGIDISNNALIFARKINKNTNFCRSSIYKLPFKDESFDLIMALEVLEHLEDPDSALCEIKRISRKYCLLSVPNEPYFRIMNLFRGKNIIRLGNDKEHIQGWTSKKFLKMLERHFEIIILKRPFPWTLVLCKKREY
ncbi:class I SAM-dependent methyltransferase [Methanooceanicella nereidis]|nr:class I SAM-dependent methyltransferase [Methanocella sp. CWC-04]